MGASMLVHMLPKIRIPAYAPWNGWRSPPPRQGCTGGGHVKPVARRTSSRRSRPSGPAVTRGGVVVIVANNVVSGRGRRRLGL